MMVAVLKWLVGKALGMPAAWKAGLAIAAVMACVGMAAAFYRNQAQEAKAEKQLLTAALDAARLTISARDLAIQKIEAQRSAEAAALGKTLKSDNDRACRVQVLREETYHAKPEDDGPVAPVLLRTLDGMRAPARAGK